MKKPEIVAYLSILLGLVGYQLFGHSTGLTNVESTEPERAIVEISNKVNRHLVETSSQIESKKSLVDSYRQSIPVVGDSIWPIVKHKESSEYGVDLSTDINEDMTYQDLNRHKRVYTDLHSPKYVVENLNADKQNKETVRQLSREEYVAQFIENARKKGYRVHVNRDLVVTSVEKIKEADRLPTSSTKILINNQ